MSEYTTVDLEINDPDCLKDALKEMGYVFEEHEIAQKLHGYQGDQREQLGHIIVRRKHVGAASNDVGFLKKPNGKYDLVISDYDTRVHGTKFKEDLKQLYGKHKLVKQVKKMGYSIKSQKVDEQGRIKIRVRAN